MLSHGTNWSNIAASHVPQRTRLALKNRYSKLRLKHQNTCSGKQASKTHSPSATAEAACETETKTNTQSLQIDGGDETDEEQENEKENDARYSREGENNDDDSRDERGEEHKEQYNSNQATNSLARMTSLLDAYGPSRDDISQNKLNLAECDESHGTVHNTQPNYRLQTIDEQWLDSVMVAPGSIDPAIMYTADGIPCPTEELMSMPLVGFGR